MKKPILHVWYKDCYTKLSVITKESFPATDSIPAIADCFGHKAVLLLSNNCVADIHGGEQESTVHLKQQEDQVGMREEEQRISTDTSEQRPPEEKKKIRGADEQKNPCCRDLDAQKSELDAFLYSVSHDLGAPLRAIQGFSLILLDQYSDKLDAKGKDYLLRMQAASRKIDHMVNDLLQISRLANAPMKIEEVDLSTIARGIVDRLGKTAPERSVTFILAEDIRVVGDKALLTHALENLLDNAWKFTRTTDNAVIEFGARQDDGERIYFIRDNGIGFSMVHAANRLFKPFQKLHNAHEYPGSGTGLAKVNRIIRRCGGKIWFESKEEKGTTLFFTLG